MKKKLLVQHLILLLALIVFILVLYVTGIGCPFRAVTGIPCPGCGLSRAFCSAAAMRIKDAFFYHPLFLLAPFYLFAAIHYETPIFPRELHLATKWFLIISTFLFIAVYLYRLSFHMIP